MLAYKIGVSVTSVYFYIHNQAFPYASRRARIERLSRGSVPAGLPPGVIHKASVKPNKSARKVGRRSAVRA
jgi:hypothetical protein